jgi:hypothetical protein
MAEFNLDAFKNATFSGAMETHFTPPPADLYKGSILEIDLSQNQGKKDPSKMVSVLKLTWELEDPTGKVKEITGQDSSRAYQDVFLDLGPDGKLLGGKGRNIGLGALREAIGQNADGKPWAPSMLVGAKATIKVEIEKFQRKDGGDGQKATVASVSAYNLPGPAAGVGGQKASAMPSRPAGR